MIGSPDLLSFATEPEFTEAPPEPAALPKELSVPLYPASPWSRRDCTRFDRDFILVSEFSEQVGPQPLLTIPNKAKTCGRLDLNHFSLRLMSADYQTAFACPSGCGYPRLNFVEDSEVVLGHSQEDACAYAYVRHLTLYDLDARGFVRPFCLAYVSWEQGKLMQSFSRLSAEFSRAAECLKTGNRKNFANELDKKLADLEYTRLVLLRDGAIGELARLEKAIQEHRSLLKQVVSFPNRRLGDPDFLPYDPGDAPQPLTEADLTFLNLQYQSLLCCESVVLPSCSHTPKQVRASLCRRFDQPLKSLEQLCDDYFLKQTLKELRSIEKSFRCDGSNLLWCQVAQGLLPHLDSTSFLFEHLEPEARHRVARAQTRHGRNEPGIFESYASCVETVPIKLDVRGNEPSPPEVTLNGSVGSGDSIEVLGVEKLFKRQGSRETPEPFPQTLPTGFDFQKRKAVTRRENSQDSIEVLSTTDSLIPNDLRASYPSAINEETLEQCQDCPNPDLNLDCCTFGALSPLDDLSDCFSSYSSASTASECPQGNPSARRWKRGRTGWAALQFLHQFPFAVHAVYSLLSGRTLVVLGSDEATVRHWVTGLTLYTPQLGRGRESIQPWMSNPLQITDLLTWKLVGFNRTACASPPSMPLCLSRYSRYLSVLDVDQRTLRCPAYSGSLICPLVEPRVHSLRGSAYFLHTQSLMGELISRAFLLTFSTDWVGRSRCRFHPHDLKILGYISELITRHVAGTPPTTLGFSYSACTTFKL